MRKLLPWEKNWLLDHDWTSKRVAALEASNDQTPVEYLTGQAEFVGLTLRVTPDVLIPRLETENLTRLIVKTLPTNKSFTFLDVGTGSGAMVIALAQHFPHSQFWASDVSQAALDVAAQNVSTYGLTGKINLQRSDLLEAIPKLPAPWVLVANLPYIPTSDYQALDQSVRQFEPALALDGGADGLVLIRRLLDQTVKRHPLPLAIFLETDPSHDRQFFAAYQQFTWTNYHDQQDLPRFWYGKVVV